jgi:hypothetical protein
MRTLARHKLAAAFLLALTGSSFAYAGSFNYHGHLTDAGQGANGRYDLQITVYPSATATVPRTPATTVYGVDVVNGAFNTEVELGDAVQSGAFIGVAVRPTGSSEFVALAGRTPVQPDGTCPDAWLVDGNAGTTGANYVGTSDAVDFHVGVAGGFVADFYQNAGVVLNPYSGASASGVDAASLGYSNGASGDYSFAAGYNAGTANVGSFVWGDRDGSSITDTAPDQFIVQSAGGMMLNGNALYFSDDDLDVHPRLGGDLDADIVLVSASGSYGRLYEHDADGVLDIDATSGVHIFNPVTIDGAISAKAGIAVMGSASKSTAGAWKANSDARIKQNIEPVTDALETLQRIHPVTFEYTAAYRAEHPEVAPQRYYNVLAQQFGEVFPDAVTGSGEFLPGAAKTPENEVLQVDTYPAQIVTMAAVQELAQKNAALQHTVDRLLARIEKLEAAQGK